MKKRHCLILIWTVVLALGGCAPRAQEETQMRVLLAGSLVVPFDHLERAFDGFMKDPGARSGFPDGPGQNRRIHFRGIR